MELYCKTVKDKPGWRELTQAFKYKDIIVPEGYMWNGSNPESLTEGNFFKRFLGKVINTIVPRFLYTLKSSCVHDYICNRADSYKNKEEAKAFRSKGDLYFKELSEMNKLDTWVGYKGVQLGTKIKYW